jgi:hypothetical protein
MPTNASNLNDHLEAAQRLQSLLTNSRLHVVDSQRQFDARTATDDENSKLPLTFADSGGLVDPASVTSDVKSQLVSA